MKPGKGLLLAIAVSAGIVAFAIPEGAHLWRIRAYAPSAPVCRVETSQRIVALTLDDGPDPSYTPEVLGLLSRNDDEATFFVLGMRADLLPDLVEDEVEAGMEVGNHTWSHPRLPSLSTADALREIAKTDGILVDDGATPGLFRAPYGEATPEQLEALQRNGLESIHWSIPLDHYVGGLGLTPRGATNSIIRDIHPGDIILAHDARLLPQDGGHGRESAMATLRLLLPELAQRGFRVTTVSNLLSLGRPILAEPRTWFWQRGFTCPR